MPGLLPQHRNLDTRGLYQLIENSTTCKELLQADGFRWVVGFVHNFYRKKVPVKSIPNNILIFGDVVAGHSVLQRFLRKLAAEGYVKLHEKKSNGGEMECDSFGVNAEFDDLARAAEEIDRTEREAT